MKEKDRKMSNQIIVDTTKVDDYVVKLNKQINILESLDNKLKNHAYIKKYNNITNVLNYYGSPIDFVWELKRDVEYLRKVSSRVNEVENFLQRVDPLDYEASLDKIQEEDLKYADTAFSIIGNFGDIGSFVKNGYNILKNGTIKSRKEGYKCIKGILTIGTKVYRLGVKVEKGKKINFAKDLLGLKKIARKNANVKNLMKKTFKKSFFGNKFDLTEGLGKCVADWATTGLDVLITGFENYQEYGGFSKRMVAETANEVFLDGLETAAITTLVTGGLTLIGFGAAPVALVGIATFGIKIGIDKFVQAAWHTDKTAVEWVSDGVLDAVRIFGEDSKEIEEKNAKLEETMCINKT